MGGVYDAAFVSVSWCGNAACTTSLCTDTNTTSDTFVCHSNSDELLDLLAPNYRTATSGLAGGVEPAFAGTSAASPYAAAQAALLFAEDPSLTPASLLATLTASGPRVTNPDNGLSFPRSEVGAHLTALIVSSNAELSALAVAGFPLDPAFGPATTSYAVEVPLGRAEVTLTAAAAEPVASVSGAGTFPVAIGPNVFEVVVTAEDGTTRQTYTVAVTRSAVGVPALGAAARGVLLVLLGALGAGLRVGRRRDA